MSEIYENNFGISDFGSRDYERIIEILEKIRPSIFDILKISGEISLSKESKEYKEEVGYFSFPCTEDIFIYQTIGAIYKISHFMMFNGHIGDEEHSLNLDLEYNQQKLRMYINLYSTPLINYRFTEFNEKQITDVETLIFANFSPKT